MHMEKLPDGFLNVDLEIRSRAKLDALVAAMSDAVFVLFSGSVGRSGWLLNLEFGGNCAATPDAYLNALCNLIEHLPPAARRLWDRASKKCFDIGWESIPADRASAFSIAPATLQRIAGLGATLAVTCYRRKDTAPRRKPTRRAP
jgi:hypothetical protein